MLASFTKGLWKKYKIIKAKCQDVLLYNKRQHVITIKIGVQYMALCNTVLYSYGKYTKDKFKHYKKWLNMLN